MQEVNVRVAVRVRPLLAREQIAGEQPCVKVMSETEQVLVGKDRLFAFDFVFGPASTQEDVYNRSVQQLVGSCFDGYNVTVFAYGQTGSGKTYTIGANSDSGLTEDELGIVPRAVQSMFSFMQQNSGSGATPAYRVKVSYLELYMEELRDLLDVSHAADINIREDEQGNTVVTGMREVPCTSPDEVLYCLQHGSAVRHTGSTQMNELSSRSHSIFTITLEQQWPGNENVQTQDSAKYEFTTGKFHFVDLAGSERAYRTGNVGDRFKESVYINTGLLSLGNVISALGDAKKKVSHVPYRDSKITRLLKDSLGGNSKTLMICCISPATCNFDESLNALKYANRARNIKNKPIINRDKQSEKLEEMQNEIQALRKELRKRDSVMTDDCMPATEGAAGAAAELRAMQEKLTSCESESSRLGALLVEAARWLGEVSGRPDGSALSASLRGGVRHWLDAWRAASYSQQTSHQNVDADNRDRQEENKDKMLSLQQEINKYRDELKGDEQIFLEKSQMINSLQKDISQLLSDKIKMESELRIAMDYQKEQEVLLQEQQQQMDELQQRLQESQVHEGSGHLAVGFNLPVSGRRAKSVPAARDNLSVPAERDVHTSPAFFSIERVMQNFRAQSAMLVERLDDEDEVAHHTFSDDEGSTSGGVINNVVRSPNDISSTFGFSGKPRSALGNGLTVPMRAGQEPGNTTGPSSLGQTRDSLADLDQHQKMIREAKLKSQEVNSMLRDLNINIRMKEQLIRQMVKNEQDAGEAMKKYAEQVRQLAEEKEQAQKDLTDLQKEFQKLEVKGNAGGAHKDKLESEYKKKIESAKRRLNALQSKQVETEKVANLSTQQDHRINELHLAIGKMKQQQEELQKRLREEHEKKEKLERNMTKEMQKIKQLEVKTNQQEKILRIKTEEVAAAQRKLRTGSSLSVVNGSAVDGQKKWLDNEIEKLLEQRLQVEQLQKELEMREKDLSKREAVLLEKSELEMKKLRASQVVTKELGMVSSRLEKLDGTLAQLAEGSGGKVVATEQLQELKKERDNLLHQKALLDKKISHDRLLSAKEERRLLELNEVLEAIDAAIDYKSDVISSHQASIRKSQVWTQSEDNLMNRLKSLNTKEAQNLLTKFFEKVVDLKEKLHAQELHCQESEVCAAELEQRLQSAESTLQAVSADAERQLLQQQTEYEERLGTLVGQLLREQHRRNDSGAAFAVHQPLKAVPADVESRTELLEKDLYYYKKTSRELKKRLRELTQRLGGGYEQASVSMTDSASLALHNPMADSVSSSVASLAASVRPLASAALIHDHPHFDQQQSPGLGSRLGDGQYVKLSRKDLRPMTAEEIVMRRSGTGGGSQTPSYLQSPSDSLDAT